MTDESTGVAADVELPDDFNPDFESSENPPFEYGSKTERQIVHDAAGWIHYCTIRDETGASILFTHPRQNGFLIVDKGEVTEVSEEFELLALTESGLMPIVQTGNLYEFHLRMCRELGVSASDEV